MEEPILFSFSKRREENDKKLPGYYDEDMRMWMYKEGKPFIIYAGNSKEQITKTFTDREKDDEDFIYGEVLTKTKIDRERDDENLKMFREFLTKTEIDREKDD